MRTGIPDYRLPPAILEREIKILERLGVDGIITNDPRLFDATAGAPAPTH